MHEVLVNRLGGLSLPRKSVARLTDRPDMTLDVYSGRKTTIQQQLHRWAVSTRFRGELLINTTLMYFYHANFISSLSFSFMTNNELFVLRNSACLQLNDNEIIITQFCDY